jgi:hypothetical protein
VNGNQANDETSDVDMASDTNDKEVLIIDRPQRIKSDDKNKSKLPCLKETIVKIENADDNIDKEIPTDFDDVREKEYVERIAKEIGAEEYSVVVKNGRKLYILKQKCGKSFLFLGPKLLKNLP